MAVEDQIQAFIDYLHNVKHTSENTELSYHRDLNKVKAYLEEQGITDIKKVTSTRPKDIHRREDRCRRNMI